MIATAGIGPPVGLNRNRLSAAYIGGASGDIDMHRLVLSVSTVLAVAAAVQAWADPCFLQRNVNGFSAPNDRTLYVRVGVDEIWRLDLANECTGLSFRQALALQGSPTGPWICSPLDATVRFREPGMSQRCPVSSIHKLTPREAAALPKKDRP